LVSEQPPEPRPEGYRNTIIVATCLGLVWFGDAAIYVVLPLYAQSFGFDALTVGVLLSVNRVVRILGYGWVAPLARAYGTNWLTAVACAAAAVSTVAYGLLSGFALLFIARMIWGAAWGIINLTMTAYAYGDGKGAGVRIGIARAVSSAGALAALVAVGPLCIAIGPFQMFVVYGLLGLAAVPFAFLLPPLRAAPRDGQAAHRWTLTPLNALFFVLSFGADGVLGATISVLLAEFMPVSSAIIGAALLLAFQRLVVIVLALFSGPVSGHVYSGTIIVIFSRALLGTVGPVLAAQKSTDRIAALASFATWTDVGLAAGAFFGLVGIVEIGYTASYALLAVLSAVAAVWHFRSDNR
jgi:MFS family permease